MKRLVIFSLIIVLGLTLWSSYVTFVHAQVDTYQTLTPLPIGPGGATTSEISLIGADTTGLTPEEINEARSNAFANFLNGLLIIIVALAGAFAVVMIITGGIKYITSESGGGKGNAKEYIVGAVQGLVLLLGSYLLLNTINPELVTIRGIESVEITLHDTPTTPGAYYQKFDGEWVGPFTDTTLPPGQQNPTCPAPDTALDTTIKGFSVENISKIFSLLSPQIAYGQTGTFKLAREVCEYCRTQNHPNSSQSCIDIGGESDNICYFYEDTLSYENPSCWNSVAKCRDSFQSRVQNDTSAQGDTIIGDEASEFGQTICNASIERPLEPRACLIYDNGITGSDVRVCYPTMEICKAASDHIVRDKNNVHGDGIGDQSNGNKGCFENLVSDDGSVLGDEDEEDSQWCYQLKDSENNTRSFCGKLHRIGDWLDLLGELSFGGIIDTIQDLGVVFTADFNKDRQECENYVAENESPAFVDLDGDEMAGKCFRNPFFEGNSGIWSSTYGKDILTITSDTPNTNTIQVTTDPKDEKESIRWTYNSNSAQNSWFTMRVSTIGNVSSSFLKFEYLNPDKDQSLTVSLKIGNSWVDANPITIPKSETWRGFNFDLRSVPRPSDGLTHIRFKISETSGTLYLRNIHLEKTTATGGTGPVLSGDTAHQWCFEYSEEGSTTPITSCTSGQSVHTSRQACENAAIAKDELPEYNMIDKNGNVPGVCYRNPRYSGWLGIFSDTLGDDLRRNNAYTFEGNQAQVITTVSSNALSDDRPAFGSWIPKTSPAGLSTLTIRFPKISGVEDRYYLIYYVYIEPDGNNSPRTITTKVYSGNSVQEAPHDNDSKQVVPGQWTMISVDTYGKHNPKTGIDGINITLSNISGEEDRVRFDKIYFSPVNGYSMKIFGLMDAEEQEIRNDLAPIQVRSTGNRTCGWNDLGIETTGNGCTSVGGLGSVTVNALKAFKTMCDAWNGPNDTYKNQSCDVIINGGTEWWYHGTNSTKRSVNLTSTYHGPYFPNQSLHTRFGKTVDLSRGSAKTNEFIASSGTFSLKQAQTWCDYDVYQGEVTIEDNQKARIFFRHETNKGGNCNLPDHWHVGINSNEE